MSHLDAMIRKLRKDTRLDEDDLAAIRAMPIHIRDLAANATIVREGDRPDQCCLMVEGFAVRSKMTDQGKRQILSIHIPGDIPDLQSLHLHVMDHDFRTLSECTVGFISHEALRHVTRKRPAVAEALWRETLIDAAMFREWIVNVGRRTAPQRLAHLLLEIRERLKVVGLCPDRHYELPMTQIDIADALGLTPVHVNRVLKELRTAGLLEMKRWEVTLGDPARLTAFGDFNPMYLHAAPEL
ncbi:MAG TPA: Crp/Fnr family transcriptional regulator [Xanthobacteraceae bacterium]|nr:Crp/Fnr family transcriptional regulator [Xanthobacteraceae bacterium]